jgi:hypothetical protein
MTDTSGTTRRRTGLVIFGVLSLGDMAALPATDGRTPPYVVAAALCVLGVFSVALVVTAWVNPAESLRLLIGLRVLSAVTALPAFFVADVPAGTQAAAAGVVVLTAVGVLLSARARTVAVA